MNRKSFLAALLTLTACLAFAACGGGSNSSNGGAQAGADELSDPQSSIKYQIKLLRAGDVDKLKACFTERVRDQVTAESVEKGKKAISAMSDGDLVGGIDKRESEGRKTAKILMANARTLTTLVETNGKWLSDTIWFR